MPWAGKGLGRPYLMQPWRALGGGSFWNLFPSVFVVQSFKNFTFGPFFSVYRLSTLKKKMERKGVMAEMKRLGRMLMKMKSLTNDDTLKSVKIEEESREETLHWSHHGSRHQNLPQKKRRRKNQQDPACFADKCKLTWNVMLLGNIDPTKKSVLLCNFQRQNKHVLLTG